MKLISININDGDKSEELLKYLKKEQPDILIMQEVWEFKGNKGVLLNAKRDITNINSLIEEDLELYYSVFSPVLDSKIVLDNGIEETGYYGNAIYTKYPIIEKETFFFDRDYVKDFVFPQAGISFDNQPRNIVKARLNTPQGEINISNIHGIYQLDEYKGDSERVLRMIDRVIKVQDTDVPTVIGGDFNLEPNTEAIQKLRDVYRELVTENDVNSTKVNKEQIIDYIFVSEEIEVKHIKVPQSINISDHYPIVLEFDL